MSNAAVTFLWEATSICMQDSPHRFCRLVTPRRTELFASVGQRIDGAFYLSLFPDGRDGGRQFFAVYASAEKAKRHAERWALAHWQTIDTPVRIAAIPSPPPLPRESPRQRPSPDYYRALYRSDPNPIRVMTADEWANRGRHCELN